MENEMIAYMTVKRGSKTYSYDAEAVKTYSITETDWDQQNWNVTHPDFVESRKIFYERLHLADKLVTKNPYLKRDTDTFIIDLLEPIGIFSHHDVVFRLCVEFGLVNMATAILECSIGGVLPCVVLGDGDDERDEYLDIARRTNNQCMIDALLKDYGHTPLI